MITLHNKGGLAALLSTAMLCAACSATTSPTPAPRARERGFVESSDGASIYYERTGTGSAVVLIHGLGGNHAVWYRQVPRLSERHTVITISQRGFAPSTGDRTAISVDLMVSDLIAVLDHLQVGDVAIVGQSMGGWTALETAIKYPDRVRGLILADTTAGIFNDAIRAHYAAVTAEARALAHQPPPLGRHPALDADFSATHPEEGYLYQLLATFGAPNPGYVAQMLGEATLDHSLLASNRVPVLMVVGEHDQLFPPSLIRRASRLLPGSSVQVIADSGHSPYYETPERWASIVEAFLDGLD